MCNFCRDIYTREEAENISHWDYDNLLVFEDGKYGIWTSCEDDYWTGYSLCNILYCPKCGRKL